MAKQFSPNAQEDVKVWAGQLPDTCDICSKSLAGINFVDGKTRFNTIFEGSWGLMCENCHRRHGCGLGNGAGQLYNSLGHKTKG